MDIQHKITLYIPSTRNATQALSKEEKHLEVQNALLFLTGLFGGATAISATGSWFDDETNEFIVEEVSLVYSYTDSLSEEKQQAITAYAIKIKTDLNQKAVTVEIDNKLYFI